MRDTAISSGVFLSHHPRGGRSGMSEDRTEPRVVTRSSALLAGAADDGVAVGANGAASRRGRFRDGLPVADGRLTHFVERQARLGGDQLLVDDNGNSEVSAEDYAIAIADLLEMGGRERERITVAW